MSQEEKNLNAFISSVNDLYKPVTGGKAGETAFDVDFQSLKRLSAGLKQSEKHKALVGQNPDNKKKNRYKDITPFDFSRVKLTASDDDPNSDYINASFIKGAEGHKNYIASQGPLPYTVLDFWQMLWQYNVSVIVMVCREIELGKKKCERYWAEKGEPKAFGGISVTLSQREDLEDGYCLRTIKAQKGSETRYIQQFHYTSWPDHGVPKTCYEIITLINHMRDVQSYSKDETSPLCVHCSAGCGRTGAVLAVDYVRNLLEKRIVPPGLKTYEIIAEMRRQRPAIVQTKDQYEFVNTAISEMFRVYLQTHSVSYKGFRDGYQKEDYVNINIRSEEARNTPTSLRPTTLYENVNVGANAKNSTNSLARGMTKLNSFDDYPCDSPPAKPSRVSNPSKPITRPVSTAIPDSASFNSNAYANYDERKQSTPAIFHGAHPTGKTMPSPPSAKPRTPNFQNNVNTRNQPGHTRTSSGSPLGLPKNGIKPPPSSAKPKLKPELGNKNFATSPTSKQPAGNAMKPSVALKPKVMDEMKKKAPIKPQRSLRRHNAPPLKIPVKDEHSVISATTNAPNNFQKYDKKNMYNEIAFSDGSDSPHFVAEPDYAEFAEDIVIPRSNSNASVARSSSHSSQTSTPPRLPIRTVESQILLSESPPTLPTRTAESYMSIEDDNEYQQTYEAVESSPTTLLPNPRSSNSEAARRSSNTSIAPSIGSSLFATKAKNMFEKTTSAFSKVSASISKTVDDDSSGSPPSTLDGRSPTFVQGPVVYNGQDMSFGQRLAKKVRGARKAPKN